MTWAETLYRAATALAEPLAPAALAWRARGETAALHDERLARSPLPPVDTWWHAASLGEIAALEPVLGHAVDRGLAGRFLVTVTTAAGRDAAQVRWPGRVALAPLDLPGATRRAVRERGARSFILVETELWPNLLRAHREDGAGMGLVNARLSDRHWPRYRRWRGAFRNALAGFSAIAARTEEDAERFRALGAPDAAIRVTGNTKHDRIAPAEPAALPWNGGEPIWTAGSLRPGEEDPVLEAFARVRRRIPGLRLVLALRHPADWPDLPMRLRARGLVTARRSVPRPDDARAAVLLLDSRGELPAVYAASTVAFIGGTLVPVGGHNVVEAAAAGIPVVFGPHRANIAADARPLMDAGAAREAADADALAAAVQAWLDDPAEREAAGARGRAVALAGRGAAGRALEWLVERGVLGPHAGSD